MLIDLTIIKDTPTAFDFTLAANQVELDSDAAKVAEVVRVAGKLKKGIVQTDVEGLVSTVLEVECVRCLQTVEMPLEITFRVGFIGAEHYTREKDAEVNITDLEISISENDKIDLTEVVREQILLNLPDRVLCRENCLGFCEKCGANRNLIDCSCIKKETDPRWAALKTLN
ncbi:MAG: DUF177 domain-containing protein [Pyrinomonadaceae bacterium]|nr:DUF177 domain-containing protein [Pyrinomonadaceae bacterium]